MKNNKKNELENDKINEQDITTEEKKLNKKLRRQNKRLKFFSINLLLIIFTLIGIVIGDYLYSKDYLRIFKLKDNNDFYSVCTVKEETEKDFDEKIEITGEYETKDILKDTTDSVYIDLKIDADNTMNLITYADNIRIENTNGTYIIEDDKLIYTRIYSYIGRDLDEIEEFVKIDEKSSFKYNFSNRFSNSSNKEIFIIDKENSELISNNYASLSLNKENIILTKIN